MIISFLVAHDLNRLIGGNGTMPWHLPDDMRWFRNQSIGKPIIMGRKTYESIPKKFRPLKDRHNIVLTKNEAYQAPGATVVHTVEDALAAAGDVEEIVIGGGAKIYELFLPYVNKMDLTVINGRFSGDTYFPEIDMDEWYEAWTYIHEADEQHAHKFVWQILEKIER